MQISLSNIGKRFNREWIFRHIEYKFIAGKKYAITGSNGSGKSTLLQVISGSLSHNEGKITATTGQPEGDGITGVVPTEHLYKYLSLAAPYLELVEEMTAREFLDFHLQFKPGIFSVNEALQDIQLEKAADKQIRYFSSGMKQRLKLAQAFYCLSPVLLLDEPTTNLDTDGIALYHRLMNEHATNKLVIICSNDKQEYDFCDDVLSIGDYR